MISDGPEPREIPTVIGLDVDEATRILEEAGFPVIKTMDTFDFKVQPSINEALVK